MSQPSSVSRDELVRLHRAAARAVGVVFVIATLLFAVAAVWWATSGLRPATFDSLVDETLGRVTPVKSPDPVLVVSMWIAVAFLALGAISYRRYKFSPVRLKAIAGLRGMSGLLSTLYTTTVRVALIGAAIAALGFASALLTGFFGDMFRAWLIAGAVLAYAYPRREAWQRVAEVADDLDAPGQPAAKGRLA